MFFVKWAVFVTNVNHCFGKKSSFCHLKANSYAVVVASLDPNSSSEALHYITVQEQQKVHLHTLLGWIETVYRRHNKNRIQLGSCGLHALKRKKGKQWSGHLKGSFSCGCVSKRGQWQLYCAYAQMCATCPTKCSLVLMFTPTSRISWHCGVCTSIGCIFSPLVELS